MTQKFVKGRTNNHLTWVMVDSTDFATPESALSAATKIKIYGKLRSGTGANFVSSGTGSLTNDIQHVGASALGIYTIALAKADLSDASAAWYDQYVISLSATGAAFQTLIVDGGIDESYLSNVASYLSNLISNLSGISSDTYSLLSDHHSTMGSQFAVQSNYLSNASNYLSYISGVVSGLGAGQSTSAIAAKVWSDYQSKVGVSPSQAYSYLSATVSALGAGQSASAIADKVWSDFGSKVGATPSQMYSVVLATQADVSDMHSDLLVMSGILSDAYSAISDHRSTTDSQFAVQSNYLSYISAVVSGLGAGASASAIADKVWSDFGSKVGVTPSQLYSVVLATRNDVSDMHSDLLVMSGILSDTYSAVVATNPTASNIAAKVWSDYESKIGTTTSNAYSQAMAAGDIVSDVQSYLVVISGAVSDVYSLLSDTRSTMDSQFAVTSNYFSNASNFQSDILSTMGSQFAVQSNYLSYISAVVSGLGAGQSASAIADKVWSDYASKVGVSASQAYSYLSATVSGLGAGQSTSAIAAKVWSDFGSKVGATPSQLYSVVLATQADVSDMHSDLLVMSGILSDTYSLLSDTRSTMDSQFAVGSNYLSYISGVVSGLGAGASASAIADKVWSDFGSKVGVTPSQVYSVVLATRTDVSDMHSDLLVMSGILSDTYSLLSDARSTMDSQYSDLVSKIGNVSVTLTASDISEIASQTAAAVGFTPSSIAAKVWSDYESKIGTTASNAYSQAVGAGDLVSDVQSYLALISGAVSDVYSQLVALSGAVSDIDSATNSQYSDLASKVGAITVTVTASDISEIASQTATAMGLTTSGIAAKVWSDYESKIGTTASNAYSQAVGAGDLVSDVQSYLQQISGAVSDIYSLLSNTNSVVVGQGAGASASAIADKVWSDFGSKVGATPSQMYSAVLATQADVSDMHSDLLAMSGVLSDTYSAITSVRAEPGQGAPGASITALEKLDYLYKAWRNKKTQTATQFSLYADDATTVDQKATTSDDGATATVGEIATGP